MAALVLAVVSRGREAVGPREPRDNLTGMDSWRRVDVPVLPGSGPAPRVYDTASGELVLAAAGPVATLYACGITPYDATHIGHAATYTAWDLLVRAWLDAMPEIPDSAGAPDAPAPPARYTVIYVQNVTDVDDPLLERAARDGEDWRELARREIQRYRSDMEALRILPPTHLVGAVEALPVIERFTVRMAERGALYDVDQDLYFAKSADPEFGALSGPGTPSGYDPAEMAELSAQRGGDPGRPGKKDPLDTLVWRAERPGEPAWASRFGRGRPGWHVECAAIATEYLGPVFDVQAGGSDLVFPHHELSASHARVAFAPAPPHVRGGLGPPPQAARSAGSSPRGDRVFARVYAHSGMVSYHGHKMSKSLGNLVFVNRLLADGVDPMAIRVALLAHHYRSDWEWTDAALADADARLARWRDALAHTEAAASAGPDDAPSAAAAETLAGVRARMRDDLDAPGALGILDRWADRLLADAPTRITPADVSRRPPDPCHRRRPARHQPLASAGPPCAAGPADPTLTVGSWQMSLRRTGGQVQAAGGALPGWADPGDGDRVTRVEARQGAGQVVGRADRLPIDRCDDRPAGHAGRGSRAPADRPDDQGAGTDRRDGRRHGQVGVAGVAGRAAPGAAGAAAVLLLLLLLCLRLRAAARSGADEDSHERRVADRDGRAGVAPGDLPGH